MQKEELMMHFQCDGMSMVKEYIGCKVDINHETGELKMMQPMLVQSLIDEVEDIVQGNTPLTTARSGSLLTWGDKKF